MAKKKNDQVELSDSLVQENGKGKPKQKAPVKAKSVFMRGLPELLLASILLISALVGIYWFADKAVITQQNATAQLYIKHFSSVLDSYSRYNDEVVKAVSDEQLAALIVAGALPTENLASHFPGALYARLVTTSPNPETDGLGFSLHDMAVRASQGGVMRPEMSFLETDAIKEQVTTYSRLVKDSADQPIAVLLVSFPLSAISTAFKSFSPDAGRIELTQIIGKERAAIVNAGQGIEGNTLTASTANPSWELTFSPSSLLGSAADELKLILIIAIAAVLVVIALFAWSLIALGRLVNTDAIAISRFSRKWLLDGDRQRPAVAVSELASLVSELDLQGDEVRSQRGIKILPPADGLGDLSVASDASLLGDAPTPKSNGNGASRIAVPPVKSAAVEPQRPALDATIFRAYDVRGIVGKGLTKDVVEALGCAIGSEAYARGDSTVVVGRDGRISGPEMSAALISGLRKSGVDVIDVGMVPTPVLYFAAKTIANGSGVMVTGSHNPANYNGFKIMLAGDTLAGDEIQALRQRIESGNFTTGSGGLRQESVTQDYIDRVSTDIALARPLRVVLDAGNGVAGAIGPRVLEELGCMVTPLFCEVDGNFPNHHPDPSKPENLQDLIAAVAANNADIGIAFDGDGDRIGVVTSKGNSIFADRLMMLYAKHMLTTNPGADIIFDVKCSRDLPALISRLGGRPVMCKTGHSFIKGKLKETNAPLAGEMSGHIFFNDRWFGFDDALYSAARLLEILSLELGDSDEMFAEFPENFTTPEINIAVEDERKFDVMDALINSANFQEGNVITIDGIRVEFSDSWGLVRASNTSPCLVARFEGKTPEALAAVQAKFKTLLKQVDSNLTIPF